MTSVQPPRDVVDHILTHYHAELNRFIQENIVQAEDQERVYQLALIRRNDLYYRGLQYSAGYLGVVANRGENQFTSVGGGLDLQVASNASTEHAFDYVTNIFRGDARKFIAVLGQREPNMKGVPLVTGNESQTRRARVADKVASYLHSVWSVKDAHRQAMLHFCKSGPAFAYTPYVIDQRSYGESEIQEYVMSQAEIGLPSFQCPGCGRSGFLEDLEPDPLTDSYSSFCPECGAAVGPQNFDFPAAIDVIEQRRDQDGNVVSSKMPNGGVELRMESPLSISTPYWIKTLKDSPWLSYEHEEDRGKIVERFPELAPDIEKHNAYYTQYGHASMLARYSRDQMSSPTGTTAFHRKGVWILSRRWARASMYAVAAHYSPELAQLLQQYFPRGLKVIEVNNKPLDLSNESIDDTWAAAPPETHDFFYAHPVFQDYVQTQDMVNDLTNILYEIAERSIPLTLADPKVVDADTFNKIGRQVAEVIPAKPGTSGQFRDAMHHFQLAQLDPQLDAMMQGIIERNREIIGILPAIFGGGGKTQTAREAELKRNQALMMLTVSWDYSRQLWARTFYNGAMQMARWSGGRLHHPEHGLAKPIEESLPDIMELLEGGWRYETQESMPMTAMQIRDALLELLTNAPPHVAQQLELLHPSNAHFINDTIGFPGLKSPMLEARNRLYEIIEQLASSKPMIAPDPMTGMMIQMPAIMPDQIRFDPLMAVEVLREWLNSSEGMAIEESNPEGFLNVVLYAEAWFQIAYPPMPMEAGGDANLPPESAGGPPEQGQEGPAIAPPGPTGMPEPAPMIQ